MTDSRTYPATATLVRHRRRMSGAGRRRRRGFVVAAVVLLACALSVVTTSGWGGWGSNRGSVKVSAAPDRTNAHALTSSEYYGDVYIFFDGAQVTQVSYYLDDIRGQHAPYSVDRTSPFDLAGTTSDGAARPFRTSTMANGSHTLLAVVSRKNGSTTPYLSRFVISNNESAAASTAPTAILSPADGPSAEATTAAPSPTSGGRAAAHTATTLSGLPWRSGATDTGDSFAGWRGRPLDLATTFENDGTWKGTEVVWALEDGTLADFKGKLSIAVPMLSNRNDTFQQCAAGAYDSHFYALGNTLKKYGREDSYIRLGWEGNGDWMAWGANGNTAVWKACFRREVQALRSVAPGVQIDWNMNKDGDTSAIDLYPGDDMVDVIGVDYYSMWPGLNSKSTWDRMYMKTESNHSPVGIGAWLAFARAHGKKLSVPEWGVNNGGGGGGGDDAAYIQFMYNFFKANASQIAYEGYFNSQCPNYCILPSGKNPQAAAKYRQLWGSK